MQGRSILETLEISVIFWNLLASGLWVVFGILGWILWLLPFSLSPSELVQGPSHSCFPSWEFFRRGQPATEGKCGICRGWTQLDEQTGFKPHSQQCIPNPAYPNILEGLQLHEFQTYFVRLLWKRWNSLKMRVKVNIDLNVLQDSCRDQKWKGRDWILLLWMLKNLAGGKIIPKPSSESFKRQRKGHVHSPGIFTTDVVLGKEEDPKPHWICWLYTPWLFHFYFQK